MQTIVTAKRATRCALLLTIIFTTVVYPSSAQLHRHKRSDGSESAVMQVAKSLSRLQSLSTVPVTDDQLIACADKMSDVLKQRNIYDAPSTIIVAVNLSIPDGAKQRLTDVFAAYTTLRQNGMSRQAAITQLHGLEQTIISGGAT